MAFDADTDLAREVVERRVVVTGAGIVTAHGVGWATNDEGFRHGHDALSEVTLFDTSAQRAHRAGEVSLPTSFATGGLTMRQIARLDRASILLLLAGQEAWDQSGWSQTERDARPPMILGTSAGAMALGEDYFKQARATPKAQHRQPTRVNQYQPQSQTLNLANALQTASPILIVSNACASGANAIGHAFRQIRSGRTDVAIAGGYDALCQLVFAGFDSLQALSPTRPCPFDANRDGLALGEGAAVVCLESMDRAQARGANILGEITGYGATTDIHHLTQPHPKGDAALASMRLACAEAATFPSEIDYINAHGTGTPLNDSAEGKAIQRWAGEGTRTPVPVSSTKGGIGHLLGAAGAVEAVVGLMTLQSQCLPPCLNIETPDPICSTFDLVTKPRRSQIRNVLTNSFGFGGSNATLTLRQVS